MLEDGNRDGKVQKEPERERSVQKWNCTGEIQGERYLLDKEMSPSQSKLDAMEINWQDEEQL